MNRLLGKVAVVTGQIMMVDGGMNSHVPTVGELKNLSTKTW